MSRECRKWTSKIKLSLGGMPPTPHRRTRLWRVVCLRHTACLWHAKPHPLQKSGSALFYNRVSAISLRATAPTAKLTMCKQESPVRLKRVDVYSIKRSCYFLDNCVPSLLGCFPSFIIFRLLVSVLVGNINSWEKKNPSDRFNFQLPIMKNEYMSLRSTFPINYIFVIQFCFVVTRANIKRKGKRSLSFLFIWHLSRAKSQVGYNQPNMH